MGIIEGWNLKSENYLRFVCFCCCRRLSNCGHPANRVFCSKAARGTGSKITIHFLKQTWFTRDHQMIHSGRIKQYKSMWFEGFPLWQCIVWVGSSPQVQQEWFIEANEVYRMIQMNFHSERGRTCAHYCNYKPDSFTRGYWSYDHVLSVRKPYCLGFCRGLVIIGIIPNVTVYWNFTRLFLHCSCDVQENDKLGFRTLVSYQAPLTWKTNNRKHLKVNN